VPKGELPVALQPDQAQALARDGLLRLNGAADAPIQLVAVGGYQLQQALLAAQRLREQQTACSVWILLEPGKFRQPRDAREAEYIHAGAQRLPAARSRLLFCHTRPEPLLGTVRTLDLGPGHTVALGYTNHGGTLDSFGMLYANRCTWAHGLRQLADMQGEAPGRWLSAAELAAVNGRGDPEVLRTD
jgi:phosphoketolase